MLRKCNAIQLALIEAERLLEHGNWVKIHADLPNDILIEWGAIHPNGMHETSIANRRYRDGLTHVEVGPVLAKV